MGALQSLFRGSTVDATLDDEILEEIKMVQSVFQDKDILELYARFHDADTSNSGYLTREAFSSMPEFENNPLKERIFSVRYCFSLTLTLSKVTLSLCINSASRCT